MLTTPKAKGELFLASSLCDGLEDNDIRQVTTLLLSKDADPNVLVPSYGITPFHLVIGNDSEAFAEEVTKLFLRHGGNPNVKSVDGLTPVHVAAAWGRLGVLELLLANGGDPIALDNERRTPFHYAFDGKYYKAITILGKLCCAAAVEEEEEGLRYKRKLDKVLVNNGEMMAEYVVTEGPFLLNDTRIDSNRAFNEFADSAVDSPTKVQQTRRAQIDGDSDDIYRCIFSDRITLRKHRARLPKIKHLDFENPNISKNLQGEKRLVSGRLIHQLSTSCTTETTDDDASRTSPVPRSRPKAFLDNNVLEKSVCSPKTPTGCSRKPTVANAGTTSKKCRPGFSKIPVRLEYFSDDRIISKSPNFIVSPATRVNAKPLASVRPTTLKYFEENVRKFNLATPSVPLKCDKIARSTPRKKFNPPCNFSSVKRLKTRKNRMLRSSEKRRDTRNRVLNQSNDASTSGDRKISFSFKPSSRNPYAINLDECKYDEEHDTDDTKDLGANSLKTESSLSELKGDSSFQGTYEENSSFDSPNNDTLSKKRVVSRYDGTMDELGRTFNLYGAEPPSSMSSSTGRTYVVSVQEEYKYEDTDKGIILLERRHCVNPCGQSMDGVDSSLSGHSDQRSSMDACSVYRAVTDLDQDKEFLSAVESCSTRRSSFLSDVPSEILRIDNVTLRSRLTKLGEVPGPITETTRRVYLKRLKCLQRKKVEEKVVDSENETSICRPIKPSLEFGDWVNELSAHCALEMRVFQEFTAPDPSRKWREGTAKVSFNYLLLDSRVTRDLPHRAAKLSDSEVWSTFVSSIFYVGKGKRSRPYAHLYDAFDHWVSKTQISPNDKIRHILNIWNDGYGVVCLHVFQNIIPVEAYTREAAMIDAIGLDRLKNCKSGEYYGIPATWSNKERSKFGKYLLYKAMQILLHEGERQLFPQNL